MKTYDLLRADGRSILENVTIERAFDVLSYYHYEAEPIDRTVIGGYAGECAAFRSEHPLLETEERYATLVRREGAH